MEGEGDMKSSVHLSPHFAPPSHFAPPPAISAESDANATVTNGLRLIKRCRLGCSRDNIQPTKIRCCLSPLNKHACIDTELINKVADDRENYCCSRNESVRHDLFAHFAHSEKVMCRLLIFCRISRARKVGKDIGSQGWTCVGIRLAGLRGDPLRT